MGNFIENMDFSPFIISIKIGVVATFLAFFTGIFLAFFVMRLSKRCRSIMDSLLTLPLVLPPTVIGFLLLIVFSLKRPLGIYLYEQFDIKIVQSFYGCVIASFVVALPLMYRNTRGAFEQIDVNLIYAGRTLGLSENMIFWRILIPAALPGIASGGVLTFARVIGEYGATSIIAGNILGKTRTMSTAIAFEAASGNYKVATFWVVIIIIFAFITILILNLVYSLGNKGFREWN